MSASPRRCDVGMTKNQYSSSITENFDPDVIQHGKRTVSVVTFLPGPSVSPQIRRVLNSTWTKCLSHVKYVVNSVALHEYTGDAFRKVSCRILSFIMVCPGNLTRQKEACPCVAAEISCLSLFEIPDVGRSGKTTIFSAE